MPVTLRGESSHEIDDFVPKPNQSLHR
jgi:hypothetical protein